MASKIFDTRFGLPCTEEAVIRDLAEAMKALINGNVVVTCTAGNAPGVSTPRYIPEPG